MQLTLRYGVLCVRLWTSELGETTKRRSPPRGNTKVDSRQTDLNVFYPPQVPSNVCCRFLFFFFSFFFFFFLCQEKKKNGICKASLYIEKHLLFSTLVEKTKKKQNKKNNHTCQFSQARAYYTAYSVFLRRFFFLTLLIVSAFLIKT